LRDPTAPRLRRTGDFSNALLREGLSHLFELFFPIFFGKKASGESPARSAADGHAQIIVNEIRHRILLSSH